MKPAWVSVIGGTGFLGRYVVQALIRKGYNVQVISRHASRARYLKTLGLPGQVVLRNGDVTRPKSLYGVLDNSYAVINLVGLLFEQGRQKFSAVHAQCPERLAKLVNDENIPHFVHVSALGVDKARQSQYARTKLTGEMAVRAALPEAVILRPSIMFGPEDNFFNQFARMAKFLPFLPLIGGGKTRFEPVYVYDVAEAIVAAIQTPEAKGQTYELGGPQIYTFEEILRYILKLTNRKRWLVSVPFGMAEALGSVLQLLPSPMLTRDQVRLLRHDNVVNREMKGIQALGINPQPVEMVTPQYLLRFRRGAKLPDAGNEGRQVGIPLAT